MEFRFILAVILCTLIFMFSPLGRGCFPQPKKSDPTATTPTESKDETTEPGKEGSGDTEKPETTEPDSAESTISGIARFEEGEPRTVDLSNSVMSLTLSTRGGSLIEARLTQYKNDDHQSDLLLMGESELESGRALQVELAEGGADLSRLHWKLEPRAGDADPVVFSLRDDRGRTIRKTIEFVGPDDPYLVETQVEFEGPWEGSYRFWGPKGLRVDHNARDPNQHVIGLAGDDGSFATEERDAISLVEGGLETDERRILWGGLESNFFAFVIRPQPVDGQLDWTTLYRGNETDDGKGGDRLERQIPSQPFEVGFERSITPGSEHAYELFLGPKDREVLSKYDDRGYGELIYYGKLAPLVRLFLALLNFFNGIVGSYGVAIILLTVLVKTVLHPINKKNQGMMQRQQKKMAKIQPQMKKLKERFKNDTLQQQREMQKLFKENDINPAALFGGCLLLFLQLPIWIGLIQTFSVAIELRHESFLYIPDLTEADHLFAFGFTIPLLGWSHFNLLPIVYVILTLINQRMMPRSDDPQMQSQQKMMTFMMVAFGFIFYNFSSGLLLYFLTSSGLGIIEQKIIRAELRREDDAAPATAT